MSSDLRLKISRLKKTGKISCCQEFILALLHVFLPISSTLKHTPDNFKFLPLPYSVHLYPVINKASIHGTPIDS